MHVGGARSSIFPSIYLNYGFFGRGFEIVFVLYVGPAEDRQDYRLEELPTISRAIYQATKGAVRLNLNGPVEV
jgi:hypothetical protein